MKKNRNVYKMLAGNSERQRPLGRSKRRRENNIKIYNRKIR
jgi:hypothetical protein